MEYEITTIDHDENSSPHTQEVEFALLLSHLITTVKQDPEQLRLTIYDFARTKLKNDLSWANEPRGRAYWARWKPRFGALKGFR